MHTDLNASKQSIKDFVLGVLDVEQLNVGKNDEKPISKIEKFRGKLLITHDGMEKSITEWAEYIGISRNTLRSRIQRGWSIEDALYRPTNSRSPRDLRSIQTFFEALTKAA